MNKANPLYKSNLRYFPPFSDVVLIISKITTVIFQMRRKQTNSPCQKNFTHPIFHATSLESITAPIDCGHKFKTLIYIEYLNLIKKQQQNLAELISLLFSRLKSNLWEKQRHCKVQMLLIISNYHNNIKNQVVPRGKIQDCSVWKNYIGYLWDRGRGLFSLLKVFKFCIYIGKS